MPTFLVFKSGVETARIQGADAKALENAIKAAVADVSSFEGSGRKLGDAPVVSGAAAAAGKASGAAAAAAGGRAGDSGKPTYFSNGQAVSGFVIPV